MGGHSAKLGYRRFGVQAKVILVAPERLPRDCGKGPERKSPDRGKGGAHEPKP